MSPRNATEIGQRRTYTYRGEQFPSVTTLLKGYPQEWAIAYGAKHVAERAVFRLSELRQRLDSDDPVDWTLKWLKRAPFERRDDAAEKGTDLHGYLEGRLRGEPPPELLTPMMVAVEQFLATYRPDPLFVEAQVVSVTERYAGSADAFVTIYGRRYVLDLKTSNSATVDHKARLQLAAYRYADLVFEDGADLGPVPECDGALVLAIPRDDPRSWQLIEVDAGPETYRRFLDFSRAWRWYDQNKEEPIGELLLPQPEEGVA